MRHPIQSGSLGPQELDGCYLVREIPGCVGGGPPPCLSLAELGIESYFRAFSGYESKQGNRELS